MTEEKKEELLQLVGSIYNSLDNVRAYTHDEDPCVSDVPNMLSTAWSEADTGIDYISELEGCIFDIECTDEDDEEEEEPATTICPNCMTRIK